MKENDEERDRDRSRDGGSAELKGRDAKDLVEWQ